MRSIAWYPQNPKTTTSKIYQHVFYHHISKYKWIFKNHLRYAKMGKWPPKSSVRYAKTQNDLSPLWAPSDLGFQKRNTYATCFLTLHSLWAPSDLFLAEINFPFDLWRGERSERNGYMDWGSEPGYTRPSHEDGTFTAANSLKQLVYIISYVI